MWTEFYEWRFVSFVGTPYNYEILELELKTSQALSVYERVIREAKRACTPQTCQSNTWTQQKPIQTKECPMPTFTMKRVCCASPLLLFAITLCSTHMMLRKKTRQDTKQYAYTQTERNERRKNGTKISHTSSRSHNGWVNEHSLTHGNTF